MWLSLVEHYVRDVGAAGSNPVIPTIPSVLTGLKGFCIALGFFICFSACTGGIVNIYALSRMYRYIIFRQFIKVRYLNRADTIIVNGKPLDGFAVNLFGLMYFDFFNQFI